MKKVILTTLLIGLFAIGSAGQALAAYVNLTPGTSASAVVDTVPASTLLDSVTSSFAFSHISGTIYQEVRKALSDGNLIFVYVITNDTATGDPPAHFTTYDFDGFMTLVANESGTVVPESYYRSSGGMTVGFNFPVATGVPNGQSSVKLIIKTDAGGYRGGGSSVLNGGADNVFTYAPVPEPTSMLLLGFGLMGLAGGKIRKRFRV